MNIPEFIQYRDRKWAEEEARLNAAEQQAKEIADEAQGAVGEAYQNPHTRTVALEAARIALGIKTIQPESQGEL